MKAKSHKPNINQYCPINEQFKQCQKIEVYQLQQIYFILLVRMLGNKKILRHKLYSQPHKLKNKKTRQEEQYVEELKQMLRTKKQQSKSNGQHQFYEQPRITNKEQVLKQFGYPVKNSQASQSLGHQTLYDSSSVQNSEIRDIYDCIDVNYPPNPQARINHNKLSNPQSIDNQKQSKKKIRLPKLYKNIKASEGYYSGKYRKNNLKTIDRQLIGNYMNAVLIEVQSGSVKTRRKNKKAIKKRQYTDEDRQPKNFYRNYQYRDNNIGAYQERSVELQKRKNYSGDLKFQKPLSKYSLPRSLKKYQKNKNQNFPLKRQFVDHRVLSHQQHLELDHLTDVKNPIKMGTSQIQLSTLAKQQKSRNQSQRQYLNKNSKYSLNLKIQPSYLNKSEETAQNDNSQEKKYKDISWTVIDPLQLQTYFVKLKNKKINQSEQITELSRRKLLQLRGPPEKNQLTHFIKNYIPQNKNIIIEQLVKSKNFRIILHEIVENTKKISIPCLYFGETLSSDSSIKQGKGILIYENYLYEGQWHNDEKIEGLQKTKMGVYKGTYKNNKREGEGQFFWSHGQYYSGQWKDGKKSGSGYWKSSADQSYMGEWANGQVNGYGIHTMKKGRKYQGQFINFLKHGFGREQFPNGDVYQGKYILGNAHGEGKYYWHQGFKYQGLFFEGYREGKGVISSEGYLRFQGFFKKQKVYGPGIMNYNNGDVFEGEYSESKRNGKGILKIKKTKQIIKGYWIDNKLDS